MPGRSTGAISSPQEATGNQEAQLLALYQQHVPATHKDPKALSVDPFGKWARRAWRIKPSVNLAYITGRPLRTCKHWLANTLDPRYRDVIAILRDEAGSSFLQHLMGEARPSWWPPFDKAVTLASLGREMHDSREQIEQLRAWLE